VTPALKRAVADANLFRSCFARTNHRIAPFLIPRPDPLTQDEQVNESRPVSRLVQRPTS
jgi:hypothetical protein